MTRTPIQQHMSAIIKGFIADVKALRGLEHDVLKGRLRELFTSRILSKLLASQFGIGSGLIINQSGDQSKQIDVIIYDRRILPPFIEEQKIGVYPAESVLAVIEVRSWISKTAIKEYSDKAKKLYDEIYSPASSLYPDFAEMKPLYNLVGFFDKGIFKDNNREEILSWMMENAKPLFGVCLVNKFSWLNVMRAEGSLERIVENNEETKAFVAVLLDNIRTLSQRRYLSLIKHVDWLSIYTRDQPKIREYFEQQKRAY